MTAGIPSTVAPYGGWEEPSCELRGHFAGGHFLSAVALASASSGNTALQSRGDALVAGLDACQKKIGNRYVSAFPPDLFEKLAQNKPVWAHFYTYHKIMAGLLDMYLYTGNSDALRIAEGMAQWAQEFMSGFSIDQRQRMLRTEYGGMNEVLVNLAATTNKDRYLAAARLFEQPSFLDPLAERRDELQGLHANTNVPKIIGAARTYGVTGDRRYRDIAEYFLAEVLTARSYVIGNTSLDEHWKTPPDQLGGTLGWSNAECCVAYNLMKLERHVFNWTGDARWMDAYEQALFNSRLGTQNAQGLKQYFFPLAAGYWRAYAPVQLQVTHLVPNAAYRVVVYRTGYHSNDAYSAYIEMGAPRDLSSAQLSRLEELTRDLPSVDKVIQSGPAGTVEVAVPMNSNDIVLVKLVRSGGSN